MMDAMEVEFPLKVFEKWSGLGLNKTLWLSGTASGQEISGKHISIGLKKKCDSAFFTFYVGTEKHVLPERLEKFWKCNLILADTKYEKKFAKQIEVLKTCQKESQMSSIKRETESHDHMASIIEETFKDTSPKKRKKETMASPEKKPRRSKCAATPSEKKQKVGIVQKQNQAQELSSEVIPEKGLENECESANANEKLGILSDMSRCIDEMYHESDNGDNNDAEEDVTGSIEDLQHTTEFGDKIEHEIMSKPKDSKLDQPIEGSNLEEPLEDSEPGQVVKDSTPGQNVEDSSGKKRGKKLPMKGRGKPRFKRQRMKRGQWKVTGADGEGIEEEEDIVQISPSRINEITCKFCEQVFNSTSNRRSHETFKCHMNPERRELFSCHVCGQNFYVKEEYVKHRKDHQNNDTKFICDVCGKVFSTRGGIFIHRRKMHLTDPPKFKCEFCDKAFYDNNHLKRHRHIHEVDRKWMCDTCGKAFKSDIYLNSHKQRVHENKYTYYCEKCGHGVQKKKYLTAHVCGRVRRQQANTESKTAAENLQLVENEPQQDTMGYNTVNNPQISHFVASVVDMIKQ